MVKKNASVIEIRNAQLIFKNFKGERGKYNRDGLRSFCVKLEPDVAKVLKRDGWNIKKLPPYEEGDPEEFYMQVKVVFGKYPPKIVMITSGGQTLIEEESQVGMLDWSQFSKVDVAINPHPWDVNGKQGIAAYLKTLYVTLIEDEFEAEYRDLDFDEES